MIVSGVGHEEVVEYNVNRCSAIHYSEMATRCGLQSMSEHVAVVLARFAFGGALGTHFLGADAPVILLGVMCVIADGSGG